MAGLDLAELVKQQLAGGASVQESLGQLAASEPKLAPVAQMLMQREQQLRAELEDEERDELVERREEESRAERRTRAAALRAHLDGLAAELDALRSQFAEVAGALGACRACFGDDPGCPWCGGRGAPGFIPPDPDGFGRLVLPALRLHVRLRGRRITEVADGATHDRRAT